MKTLPIVWSFAASDCSAAAGIQVDLKTFAEHAVHGCTIVTALTAQNHHHVAMVASVSQKFIHAQVNCLQPDFLPKAVKLSVMGESAIACIATTIRQLNCPVIYDPVLVASSGDALVDIKNIPVIQQKIFPAVHLLTPNRFETKLFTGIDVNQYQKMPLAANALLAQGVASVLIKGGHLPGNKMIDYWTDGKKNLWLWMDKENNARVRGTGCALSAAITSNLALGYSMTDAIVLAKAYLTEKIRRASADQDSIQLLKPTINYPTRGLPNAAIKSEFTSLNFPKIATIGIYPIIDCCDLLEKLLLAGISTVQLRIKDLVGEALENQIKQAVAIAKKYNAQLFINDYWQLAIKYEAFGVHLGQEDLLTADLVAIAGHGLRLGISTHNITEFAIARTINPSYLACGPVLPTTSKPMSDPPLGISALHFYRQRTDLPMVAIGGIKMKHLSAIKRTGVNGVAVISAITQTVNPIASAIAMRKTWSEIDEKNQPLSTAIAIA